jgi:uncharacterized cupin superfamily protein
VHRRSPIDGYLAHVWPLTTDRRTKVLPKVEEAPLRRDEMGLVPDGDGWFIVNIAESQGAHTERFGDGCMFEGRIGTFPELGVNVRVLQTGQPAAMYHREGAQEAFIVLSGECVAIVEDEERPMRKGDFLHSPPGTAHVLVGAGEGRCAVLMVGARKQPLEIEFPASSAAARYGASVEEDTYDRGVAYAGVSPPEPAAIALPW